MSFQLRGFRFRLRTAAFASLILAALAFALNHHKPVIAAAPDSRVQVPNRLAPEVNVSSSSESESQKFAELSDRFMKDSLALSPVSATAAGYHKHLDPKTGKTIELDALLDDMSMQAINKQRDFYAAWRERFRTETPPAALDPQDAADWHLLDDQIGLTLLEFDHIQSYRHHPTVPVELIGNAIFLPLTQTYAPKDVRIGHVLSRVQQVPRLLDQVKRYLSDADPVFVKTAIEENDGNIDLIQHTLAGEIAPGSALKTEYDRVAPPAVKALKDFSRWLRNDLGKRPSRLDWRLGKQLYDQKFKLVMETDVTPEDVLASAERDLQSVRAEMLETALPMHARMFPEHGDHSDLAPRDRENRIIGEVLDKIALDHPRRDQLQSAVEADLASITQFIREKKIVSLSSRENLKVVPTPLFMRGIYSVGGFMSAPPLEPKAQAQYWVTPIDPKWPEAKAESKLREYNSYVLKWLTIHEALPGHYIQFEHLNSIQPERRRLLRSLYANGAYVEGWAEYIAQVMMDEGFLDNDPRFRLEMRKIRLRLLANAILDVRLQTMGMTDAQAMDLMTNDAFQTQAEAEGKLRRAKLSSTQLPTYYVGLREWLAFRKRYQDAAGKNFNLMKFHDAVLDEGPLPVPVVEKLLMPSARKQ
ncbi:MAG TPA: DUF885 domain-containing protein [Candidatus Polarisedimenticolia bacterium]|nr:DUF885 domain-containing protein [Candidatus Polarisedimenticolia bacterium]